MVHHDVMFASGHHSLLHIVTYQLSDFDIVECGVQVMKSAVAVPQSIPGLVTKDILVMTFLEGEQITRLKVCRSRMVVT